MWGACRGRNVGADPQRVSGPETRKEYEMTSPSITAPLPHAEGTGRAFRLLLITLAILVVATVAFVVGRVTASGSSPAPINAPAVSRQLTGSIDSGVCQQVGHFVSSGC
jgi:hypothetical protein